MAPVKGPFALDLGNDILDPQAEGKMTRKKMMISGTPDKRQGIKPSQVAANNDTEAVQRIRLMPGKNPKQRIIRSLFRWAGRKHAGHHQGHLLPRLGAALNTRLGTPLKADELEDLLIGVAVKIASFDHSEEGLSTWRSERGRRAGTQSGVIRRQRTIERDRAIILARKSGMTQKAVAVKFGISQPWISQLEKRVREEKASRARLRLRELRDQEIRQADQYNLEEKNDLVDFEFAQQFYDRRSRRTSVTTKELIQICDEEERLAEKTR